MKISVVIPAYNEAGRIPITLESLKKFFRNDGTNAQSSLTYELILVNDGSTDTTKEIIENSKIQSGSDVSVSIFNLEKNKGKGYAVRYGLGKSTGDVALFMDADSSTPITELPKLLPYINSHDIVIGSRALDNTFTNVQAPLYRRLVTLVGKTIVQSLVRLPIRDTQCGFKLFSRKALDILLPELSINGFGFDIELLAQARKLKLTVKEVPVAWDHKHGSRFKIFLDSLKVFGEILKIRNESR